MIELSSKTADQLAKFLADHRVYPDHQISDARDWIADAYPQSEYDMSDTHPVYGHSAEHVQSFVDRRYPGGWDAFVSACTEATPQHEYAGRIRGFAARAWVDKVGGGTVGRAYSGDFRVWIKATGQAELLADDEILTVPEGLFITHAQAAKIAIELAIMNADNT